MFVATSSIGYHEELPDPDPAAIDRFSNLQNRRWVEGLIAEAMTKEDELPAESVQVNAITRARVASHMAEIHIIEQIHHREGPTFISGPVPPRLAS
jgi:hypothetical protein